METYIQFEYEIDGDDNIETYEPRRRRSVFDEPREDPPPPPPGPCITFSRSQVLLHNLRVIGYDLSQVAANDQGRLSAALEVALCQKRGLTAVEEIATTLGLTVDAVRSAANDLHRASGTR